MRFADVIGHARALAQLRPAAADRTPGAVLLLGPPGIGKRTLADAFTARLLCQAPAGEDACGTCAQCTRVATGNHPDVRVVAREEDRRDIRIEQARELCRWLAFRPLMAGRKVAVIDGAHELNEHGQNALLKTLEEPPGASVLLLLASASALVLPTVRSRCRLVRLDPLPLDAVTRVLEAQGLVAERARVLAPLAEGCPGRALALDGEAQMRARDLVLARLPELPMLAAGEVSQLALELSREPPDAALAAAVAWYRDVLQTALVGDAFPLRNPDAAAAVREAAARSSPTALLRQLEGVCDTIVALERNANRMLALETMLLWLRDLDRGRPAPAAASLRASS